MDPEIRRALAAVPPAERDAWVDALLGIDGVPADGPELPRGCVPYMPCGVDLVLEAIDRAAIDRADVFVDVGAGIGRAALLVHALTGARVVGVEIQPHLVAAARALAAALDLDRARCAFELADAAAAPELLAAGTVFFLYCPFSGERLAAALSSIERAPHARAICAVDLPPLALARFSLAHAGGALSIYTVS